MLEVSGLRKSFGRVRALDEVSFAISQGEIFGYLGPNGAGKSTTLRVIADLVRPDQGNVQIFGKSHRRPDARESIGFLPGELKFYGTMTGQQLLDLFAGFRPRRPPSRRAALMDALEIGSDTLSRRIKFLSHGTKQKIGIILAMQHEPGLLLLDEPTLGLDPLVQQTFRRLLVEFAGRGGAVLFSSHILSEVEEICRRVAILRAGRIVAQETIQGLRANMVRRLRARFRGAVPSDLGRTAGVIRANIREKEVELLIQGDINPIFRLLASADLEELVFPEPELEDIFLTYYRSDDA